jgi:hypothetical protein
MAVSSEDLAAGALALQMFVKNAKYVEIIVGIAFGAIPTILGLGAAGLIGSGIINTARDVKNSISLLKTVGPGIRAGIDFQKIRWEYGKKLQQSDKKGIVGDIVRGVGVFIAPDQWIVSKVKTKWKKNNQDTQGKQEGQGGGGGGGSPPTPPDTKSDKKEDKGKINGIPWDEYMEMERRRNAPLWQKILWKLSGK